MHPLEDDSLASLIAGGESERVELKRALNGSAAQKVREAICAFANDLPGTNSPGVIIVGLRDDGQPSGLAIVDSLLRQLADMKSDGNILPPPSILVEKRSIRGSDVAAITVFPSDSPPVRYDGRIHVRIGPRRSIATAQDERILNERRRAKDRTFDIHAIPTAEVSDLDRLYFSTEYLRQAFSPDVLEENDRNERQRLAATKMIASEDSPHPTVLGILILGIRPRDFLPGAYIQFLRIDGTELADPVTDEAILDGTIMNSVRGAEGKLQSHNRRSVDFTSSATELRMETFPLQALQQLIRNAIMHRTYESTNAPVRITWFNDRIEILSPGGPYGLVTTTNFGRAGLTDYRNPNLAEAMRVMGYVQRFGAGIATARRLLTQAGHPELRFETTENYVLAIVRSITS